MIDMFSAFFMLSHYMDDVRAVDLQKYNTEIALNLISQGILKQSEIIEVIGISENDFEEILLLYRQGQEESSESAKLEGSKEKAKEIALQLHKDRRYTPSEILELTGLSQDEFKGDFQTE
ncbi:MAG: hypothetical protein LBE27_05745 [Deltaproteobacteria bacterium]|jgi:predicted XRE-type DNA-binding protein|nr:hypothetical protein [Deltaproteobacteria bacterium]